MAIDSAGKLPGGDAFQTVPEFRRLMVERQGQFTRCLTEKLMTYALGRELEIGDRPAIDRICKEMSSPDKGLRDLILAVVVSQSFQQN